VPIDYSRFVGHGWAVFSRHRVLWLLGFVMALGTAGITPLALLLNLAPLPLLRESALSGEPPSPAALWAQWGGVALGGAIVLGLLSLALGFISAGGEATLISAVDQIERTGRAPRFGVAWGRGSRRWGPLWLLSLLIGLIMLALTALAAVPALPAVVPLLNQLAADPGNPRVSSGFMLGLACSGLLFLPVTVLTIVLSFIRQFAAQAVVLDGAGVLDALAIGWRMLRQNVAPALVIVLVTYIASYVTSFIIAPVTIVFLLPLFALGMGQPGDRPGSLLFPVLIVGGSILYGAIVAAVSGLLAAFTTTLWTLLYRYRRALPNGDLAPVVAPPYGRVPYNLVPGSTPGAAPPYPLTPPAPHPPPPIPPER
jgi:hypothetical protein